MAKQKDTGQPEELTGSASQASRPEGAKTNPDLQHVLVEIRIPNDRQSAFALEIAKRLKKDFGFQVDSGFEPVPVGVLDAGPDDATREEVVLIRGTVGTDGLTELGADPQVVAVWLDTPIEPFVVRDCAPTTPKGETRDVVISLGVDQIWDAGFQGEGITIAIVDGGIAAEDRAHEGKIARVIGGWPREDWGQRAEWHGHGNMCAADALAMAPRARLYDIRLSDSSRISNAIAGFHWAIKRHTIDGTPHILCNAWGIYQKGIDPSYATNPNHPFTMKVTEAVNEGITVIFATGNCGKTCPDGKCGQDNGPGLGIWGANGHSQVMTIGAVNVRGQLIGYSSEGPAALDANKPDFCSISHFKGYYDSDTGTSVACAVTAGVVALLKQRQANLSPQRAKEVLRNTARQIDSAEGDPAAGAGIIQAKAAFDQLQPEEVTLSPEWRVPWLKDGPPEEDLLGREDLARSLAGQLRWIHEHPPAMSFLIHLDGPWGSGKTTLLRYLRKELENTKTEQEEPENTKTEQGPERFLCIELNAWREQRIGPPWWSILMALRRQRLASAKWYARPSVWLLDLWDRLRVAWVPYLAGLLVLVGLLAGLYAVSSQDLLNAGKHAKVIGSILALGGTLLGGVMALTKFGLLGSTRSARLFVEMNDNPMQGIGQLFTRSLRRAEHPVVFFIDDLDRANEEYVVEFLEAVQTLVRDSVRDSDQSTVKAKGGPYFVVAADGRWIRIGYEQVYATFRAVQSPGVPLGYLFLEKIFQLTVRLPGISEDLRAEYFANLLDVSQSRLSSDEKKADEMKLKHFQKDIKHAQGHDQLMSVVRRVKQLQDPVNKRKLLGSAAVKVSDPEMLGATTQHALKKFSSFLEPNPRSIKLFVNKYSVLRALRILEGVEVELGPLGLWTVVEMRWPALGDHLRVHPDDVCAIRQKKCPLTLSPNDNLRSLFENSKVHDVVCDMKQGPLTPELVRKCAGETV